MEINGIAHIQLTVNDLARAMPFYEAVLGFMGMALARSLTVSWISAIPLISIA